jgi:hypothetical protein
MLLLFMGLTSICPLRADSNPEINGTIRSDSGENLAGIRVLANNLFFSTFQTANAITDTNGVFRLPVIAGDWHVEVNAGDLLSAGYHAILPFTVHLSFQNFSTQIVAHLIGPTNHLYGRLLGADGEPFTNWVVTALESNGAPLLQAETGSSGAFDLNLFSGAWSLTVEEPYPGPVGNWCYPRRTIEMLPETDQQITLIVFAPTANISGTARGSDGKRFQFVQIRAVTEVNNSVYEIWVSTDSQGHYTIPVFDAEWTLTASQFVNTGGYGSFPNQLVSVHHANEAVNFVAQAPAQLASGKAVDLQGHPLVSAQVMATKMDPPFQFTSTTTDDQGNFAVAISPGKWNVYMRLEGWLQTAGAAFYVAPEEQPHGLILQAMRTTGRIEIQIDPGYENMLNASTKLNGQRYDLFPFSDAPGHAWIDVFDGVWTVSAPWVSSTVDRPPEFLPPASQTVVVQGNTQSLVFALQPFDYPNHKTHLRGQLQTSDGLPLPLMEVIADNGIITNSVLTDAAGRFDFEAWEGTWSLYANDSELQSLSLLSSVPWYYVTNGVDINGIEITATARNAAIQGSVKDEAGAPVVGIALAVFSADALFGTWVTSDLNGVFTTDAFDGDWLIWYTTSNTKGFQSVPQIAVPVTNGIGSVDITLHPLSGKYWIPQLSSPTMTDVGFQLTLSSQIAESYRIEASADLSHWTPILTNRPANGSVDFTDSTATNASQHFYRASLILP